MNTFTGWASTLNTIVHTTGQSGTPNQVSGQLPGVFCYVFISGSTTLRAAILSTEGTAFPNPFLVNPDGSFSFNGNNSTYDLAFSTSASGVVVSDPGIVQTVQPPSYAYAALPATNAQLAGQLAKLTDADRNLWMSNGAEWFSLGNESADVKAFGAVGDGISDDAPAIQAAINSLHPTLGGVVYFPPAPQSYLVGSTITFGKGVRLIGSGKYASVITNGIGGPPIVLSTISGAGGGQEIAFLQVVIQNIGNVAIQISGVDRASLHDCVVYSSVPNATLVKIDVNSVSGAYTHRIHKNILQFSAGHPSQSAIAIVGGVTSTVFQENHILADNCVNIIAGTVANGANIYIENLFTSLTAGPTGTAIQFAGGSAPSTSDVVAFNYFDHFSVGLNFPSGCASMMIENNHWDNVTTHIVDSNPAQNAGSLIDLDTQQISIGTTVGGNPGTMFVQGDGGVSPCGYRSQNIHSGGRGWSLMNGQSAADEFSIRDDNVGAYLTKWNATGITHTKRQRQAQGASIVAANDLTLGTDGNVFTITGNTQINAVVVLNWLAGSVVTLLFTGTPTVKHNTAGSAGTAKVFLSGSVDFVAANNGVLTLLYDGTEWQETARKVA